MRFLLIIVLSISSLFSQQKVIDFSELAFDRDFTPSHINVGDTGIYFLDTNNRQISFIDNNHTTYNAGGYGTENDAFIDPINILSSKLNVWVVDGTENKLITFDSKLNYLSTLQFKEIYPTLCAIDDWGNIYLYSEIENKLYKINYSENTLTEFIDLSIYNVEERSVNELYIAKDGSIAVVGSRLLFTFNRLGRLELNIPISEKYRFIFKKGRDLYGVSDNGIVNLFSKKETSLSFDKKVLDIEYSNNKLYFLLNDQIQVINAKLE